LKLQSFVIHGSAQVGFKGADRTFTDWISGNTSEVTSKQTFDFRWVSGLETRDGDAGKEACERLQSREGEKTKRPRNKICSSHKVGAGIRTTGFELHDVLRDKEEKKQIKTARKERGRGTTLRRRGKSEVESSK